MRLPRVSGVSEAVRATATSAAAIWLLLPAVFSLNKTLCVNVCRFVFWHICVGDTGVAFQSFQSF